jgi:diguanylate cyclase (GGDEF)-like protein
MRKDCGPEIFVTEDRSLLVSGPSRLDPVAESGTPPPQASIVERSIEQARHSVALALSGAALAGSVLIIGGVVAERLWLSQARDAAVQRHTAAQQLAGEAKLADYRLTAAAQMAVATGATRWVEEYDARRPELQRVLQQARSLVDPETAQRFDARSGAAYEELESMRESAFEALTVGSAEVARSIFDGERYRANTRRLSMAIDEFTAAAVQATRAETEALQRRTLYVSAAALIAVLALEFGLWKFLAQRLGRSRTLFLDAENRIQRLASSDLLTGLANRSALRDAMSVALARARREQHGLAVLMVDLDRFKPVNDRHGHMVGDRVLKEVAQRLARTLRAGEPHARYGGDEFVVVVEERDDAAAARVVAERIVASLGEPMLIDTLPISIGASVGVARFPDDADSDDALLRMADSALYRAKAGSSGSVCFYDPSLDEQVAERATLEHAVREGIARGEFLPYYQPIVDLASRAVQAVELLCRWNHPQRGLLAPAHFIALAENSGLIGPMSMSLLRQACVDLAAFPVHWRLSMNIAPQQILDPALVPQLLAVLSESGVAPSRLDVELTETALVGDTVRARAVIQALQAAGITVTLDDFGTGYSSLAYLAEMSFDKIKIDRSFVRTLHERPQSAKIVDAVIGLSRSLGVQTVAEGVETERDARVLLQLGCALAQGYLFSRPLPADQLMKAFA